MRCGVSRLLASTALGASMVLVPAAGLSETRIGTVAAVNPSMDGTPPARSSRVLTLGTDLIENERVETSDDGSGQLLFLDQTTLTVAPRSDLVLDKYIYDPAQQSGDVTLSLSKGVMRFIGGRITKNQDAIIRTPTATIGIRGGLAVVIVESNGSTRICHLAGEYSRVEPNAGGVITLSRPNACAYVEGSGGSYQGLISSAELAKIYDDLEGRGTGGKPRSATAVDSSKVSEVNSDDKGGEDNEPVSTSGHSAPSDQSSEDENQVFQDDGETEIVLLFPSNDDDSTSDLLNQNPNEDIGGQDEGDPDPDDEDIIVVTGLGGGFFNADEDGETTGGFTEVQQGSLIGIVSGGGEEVRVPVPLTALNGVEETEIDNSLVNELSGDGRLRALSLSGSSGLFEFSLGDVERDAGDVVGGSFSATLGDIEGIGFTDPSEEFTYIEFVGQNFQETEEGTGFAVFGEPTVGQGLFFDNTRNGGFADADVDRDGNEIVEVAFLNTNDLPNLGDVLQGVTNTVEAFEIEPNLVLGSNIPLNNEDGVFFSPLADATPLFLIGNEGMARFETEDVDFVFGESLVNPNDITGGGKWLNGVLQIDAGGGNQNSTFLVLADDVESRGGTSGPQLASSYIGTQYDIFSSEEFSFQSVAAVDYRIGAFEDGEGNTQFGETNRYMVISSVNRDGGLSQQYNPGEGVVFDHSAGGSNDATDNVYSVDDFTPEPFVNLATSDPLQSERVTTPLPLAGARNNDVYSGSFGQFEQQFNRGFSAGLARCETGLCGDDGFNSRDFDGFYALQTRDPDAFVLNFGSATASFDSLTGDVIIEQDEISNEVDGEFNLISFDAGNVDGAFDGEEIRTAIDLTAGGTTSAFIDDNRFGLVGNGTDAVIAGQSTSADVAIASTGLVGTGELSFPGGTDIEHEFLRWGWWSASYDLVHDQDGDGDLATRTDVVHLGTWVAGIQPDVQNIPTSGTAAYNGFAAGTHANVFTGETRVVGGSFDLQFNFGTGVGEMNLNIPDANLNQEISVDLLANGDSYFGIGDDGLNVTRVQGGFLDNPAQNDATAATAGQFNSRNDELGTRTIGVFGGDRTSANNQVLN